MKTTKPNRPAMPPPPPECPPAPVHKKSRKPPTVYRPEMCQTIISLAKKGWGIADIIEELDINSTTNTNWKRKYPAYAAAWERHDALVSEFYAEVDRRRAKMLKYGNSKVYDMSHAQTIYDLDDFTMSRVELAALLNISKRTINQWVEDHEEFAEAVEWYDTQSEAYWMRMSGEFGFLPSKLSQPRLITFNMANRFGLTEKVEVKQNNSSTPPPPQVHIHAVSAHKPKSKPSTKS